MPTKYGRNKIINKNDWKCKHCDDPIDDQTDNSIECSICCGWYHVECTLLDRKKFMHIVKSNDNWLCHLCSDQNLSKIESLKPSTSSTAIENDFYDTYIGLENDIDESSVSNVEIVNQDSDECIRCLTVFSDLNYQEIFNKTGKNLGLQTLLSKCFGIDVTEDKNKLQAICDKCVNELIEAYDLMQSENPDEQILTLDDLDIKAEDFHSEIEESDKNSTDDDSDNGDDDVDNDNEDGDDDDMYDVDTVNEDRNVNLEGPKNKTEVEKIPNLPSNYDDENAEFENVCYLDEFDEEFDFRAYKEKAIKNHKFDKILFPSPIECRICLETLENHVKILEHTRNTHNIGENNELLYPCVIDEQCTPSNSFEDLSFHLVFKHYDLENLLILTECPECNQFFENFPAFNKHCCDKAKKYGRRDVECEHCGKVFKSNKRYRFHLQFHLEKRRPKACFICDTMFRDEDEFYDHIKYEHEKNLENICKMCDLVFSTEENLKNHVDSSHNEEHVYYNCPKCRKPFSTLQHLKQHMIVHSNLKYKCDVCGKCLTRKSRLSKHLIRHQKPIKTDLMCCSTCGLIVNNNDEVESHLLKHNDTETFIECQILLIAYCCEHCDQAYNTIENLLQHRKGHPSDEFICTLCDVKYSRYSTISSHRASHAKYMENTNEFPIMKHFVCGISDCKKTYPLWTTLNIHRMKNHQSRNSLILNCPKCNLNFPNKFEYRNHLSNSHKGKLIFDCQFCDKSFRTKSALKLHVQRVHKDRERENLKKIKKEKKIKVPKAVVKKEKKYQCKICEKPYYNKSDVVIHEKAVHEKEAKFFCNECSFKTPYKQTLVYHMQTHKDEYPYQCSICCRSFRFKNSHKLHEQRHQNHRNFTCNIDGCNMSYINLGRLKTHQKLKHGPNTKSVKTKRRHYIGFNAYTDTFVDDDDGLDDGFIDEKSTTQIQPQIQQTLQLQQKIPVQSSFAKILKVEEENFIEDTSPDQIYLDVENNYITDDTNDIQYYAFQNIKTINEIDRKPVLIVRNNDYILELDHKKIYGNALEVSNIQETEVGATEIVGE